MHIHIDKGYDKLNCLLMVYPVNFPNGNHQVDRNLLFHQYNNFINLLINHGIRLQFLDITNSNEQVFTRDIGFVIKDIFFVSKLKKAERQLETKPLLDFIKKYNLKYYELKNHMEGGDVILHGDILFIGVSDRTSIEGIREVQTVLDENKIDVEAIPIRFDKRKTHLDCAFNTLDKDNCLISDYVYDIDLIQKHIKNCFKLNKSTADELGTNIVYLGEKKVITSSRGTYDVLNSIGFEPYYVDFSEVIKGSGSFGCCTLPILTQE